MVRKKKQQRRPILISPLPSEFRYERSNRLGRAAQNLNREVFADCVYSVHDHNLAPHEISPRDSRLPKEREGRKTRDTGNLFPREGKQTDSHIISSNAGTSPSLFYRHGCPFSKTYHSAENEGGGTRGEEGGDINECVRTWIWLTDYIVQNPKLR